MAKIVLMIYDTDISMCACVSVFGEGFDLIVIVLDLVHLSVFATTANQTD